MNLMTRCGTAAALLALLGAAACSGDRGDTTAPGTDQPVAEQPDERQPDERQPEAQPPGTAPAESREPAVRETPAPPARPAPAAPSGSRPRAADNAPTAAPATRAAEWREVTIPNGTALPLELETALSSETAQVEMPVRARLKQAIVVNGVTALPANALVSGEVIEVERAGKVKGRARLAVIFTTVQADGVRETMRTNPLTYIGEASKGEDATKIGAGAVGGAIVGGILGGGSGAAKGAVIGGAAGTGVVLATRGQEVTLASGAGIAPTLAAPLAIRVPVR